MVSRPADERRRLRRLLAWLGVTVVLLALLVGWQLVEASGRP